MPRQINIADVIVSARPVEEGGSDQLFRTAQDQGVTAAIPRRLRSRNAGPRGAVVAADREQTKRRDGCRLWPAVAGEAT